MLLKTKPVIGMLFFCALSVLSLPSEASAYTISGDAGVDGVTMGGLPGSTLDTDDTNEDVNANGGGRVYFPGSILRLK